MSFLDKSAYKYRSRYLNLTFIKLPRVPTHPYNTRYKAKIIALRQRILYEVAEELAAKGPFQVLKLSESRNELPNSESDVNVADETAQPRDSLEDSHSEDTAWLDSLEDSHSEEDSSSADYPGETLQSVYYYQTPHGVEESVEPSDSLESFQSGEETAQSIVSFEDSYSEIETIQPIDSLDDSHCEETVLPMNFLEDSSYTVDQERIQSMDASEDSSIAETEETVTSMDSSEDSHSEESLDIYDF